MMPGSRCVWRCRGRRLELGGRTWIAGVLNLTPDSFSDGGAHPGTEAALRHARRMLSEGADLLDLGAESSRPGAEPVSSGEEQRRLLPVLRALRSETAVPISIDTRHAETAAAALECGADILNDITALRDPGMAAVAARYGAGLVLMHMQGDPATMQQRPGYGNVVAEVEAFLQNRVRRALEAGVTEEAIALDPGIGFGKSPEHNTELLRSFSRMRLGSRPWWIGVSRKSWLGTLTGRPVGERLAAGLGALAYAALNGAHVLRVHDVKESCDAARVVDHLSRESNADGMA
jgi:dihydropteroate synthase